MGQPMAPLPLLRVNFNKIIEVTVNGDSAVELDETFGVSLSNAANATIDDGEGIGTIVNDDSSSTPPPSGLPSLTARDASITEGDNGTKLLTFSFKLSEASTETITVDFSSEDISAVAGIDYEAKIGTLIFQPGQTNKRTSLKIIGDSVLEADETVRLKLSNPTNVPSGKR